MSSGSSSKEERRNLRKEMGTVAAAAVVELRGDVQRVNLEHRTLARQMLEFEGTVATVRQGRASDQERVRQQGARLDELGEQLEALLAKFKELHETDERLNARRSELDDRVYAIERWALKHGRQTRWQRLRSLLAGKCAVPLQVDARTALADRAELAHELQYPPVTYVSKDGGPLERVASAREQV